MSYIALARHWRPRSFNELLGQDIIKQTLTQALIQNRLHHAYLFTGTRGVGKTSIARLLAKALNCEQGISGTPCLTCETCVAIEQSRFVDLLEIDGASKTKVEDIRELLEKVQYAPVTGRFKIYLIDEVHMLSQHSFNALLKTLEEPPAHVKFLLATTDPQKIPPTILSRCIQLNLKPIDKTVICAHLETILHAESRTAEPGAMDLIALAAQGSMRDALSILEQVIASAAETIQISLIKPILGYTQLDYTHTILEALTKEEAETLLSLSHKIAAEGGLYRHVLESLLSAFHQLACEQQLPPNSPWSSCPVTLKPFAQCFDPQILQLFYQITLKGLTDLTLAPTPAIGFEMTLIRLLAFQPAPPANPPTPEEITIKQVTSVLSSKEAPECVVPTSECVVPAPECVVPAEAGIHPSSKHTANLRADPSLSENDTNDQQTINWPNLIQTLKLSGLVLHAAEQSEFVSLNHATLTLNVLIAHRSLFTPNVIKQLEAALTKQLNLSIKVTLNFKELLTDSPAQQKQRKQKETQQNALQASQQDATFQTLQTQFDAKIISTEQVET